jgi:hypothetical protein
MTAGGDRLGTVTELEMLNGANRALLIDPDGSVEVIAFANVSANHFGSYQLDTLLRGLRGTEGVVGDHVIGALFLLLEEDTLHRLLLPLAELDQVRYYRAVGRGGQLSDAPTVSITPIGRDLMPYAPVHLKSNGNAWGTNITLSWVRQTRLGGEWVDSFAGGGRRRRRGVRARDPGRSGQRRAAHRDRHHLGQLRLHHRYAER